MFHVRRDGSGQINLISRHPYEDENGSTTELLPDDHEDILAFISSALGG